MALLRCAAKFDPFLSLDCAPTPSTLAQSKERKESNIAIWEPCNQEPVAAAEEAPEEPDGGNDSGAEVEAPPPSSSAPPPPKEGDEIDREKSEEAEEEKDEGIDEGAHAFYSQS